ncbi:PAS domain-containing protein [Dyadobacter sp. CY312]|uniref:PAS domain-containing protein n=1 Tax=Dyadobacter sp. CY312 TaxID=2907303 RepID=UPI001F1AC2E7|nr:PAS domain-containing protein [Dyadobacter sp. CY312]MCE7040040.1 PAS domain-containing protein [Dyadobacter sp. CY312]
METKHTSFGWDQLLTGSSTGYMVFVSQAKNTPPDEANKCVFANPSSETLTGFNPAVGATYSGIFGNEYDANQKERTAYFSHSGKICQLTESRLSDELVLVSIIETQDPPFANLMPAYSNLLWKEAEKTMQFGGWIWNPDHAKVEWSEGMFRLMGYDSGELKEQRLNIDFWAKHVHPEDRDGFNRQIEAIPSYIGSYILEFRIIDNHGREKSLYLKGQNVSGKKPGSIVAIGTAFDFKANAGTA